MIKNTQPIPMKAKEKSTEQQLYATRIEEFYVDATPRAATMMQTKIPTTPTAISAILKACQMPALFH